MSLKEVEQLEIEHLGELKRVLVFLSIRIDVASDSTWPILFTELGGRGVRGWTFVTLKGVTHLEDRSPSALCCVAVPNRV